MTTKRRFFTDEFKQEAVALLESSECPLEHIAKELGVQPSVLHNWPGNANWSASAWSGTY
ncbi:MAG TPA: transposase [Azospirillaceae bacterium]|nr:transposase [Azospirillaceae bacterium]